MCVNKNSNGYNYPVYQYIRETGGWRNWELLVIERVEFEFGFELKDRERHHMETMRATLNVQVPNRTREQYRQDNFEQLKTQQKEYRQDNSELIKAKKKEYYHANFEQIKAKQREFYYANAEQLKTKSKKYRQDNSELIKTQKKKYRQANVEQLKTKQNQKHTCDCGGRYTQCNKAAHFRSKKHRDYNAFMALTEEQVKTMLY
jgi:hypothetical protein